MDRLSEKGKQIVIDGLERGLTLERIISHVREQTGEQIAKSSLQRFAKFWEERAARERALREEAAFLAEAVRDADPESLSVIAKHMMLKRLMELSDEIQRIEPGQLMMAISKHEQVEVEKKKLGLARDRYELEKQRLELEVKRLEARIEQAKNAMGRELGKLERAAKDGRALTQEDIRAIKEIYGIYDEVGN